MSETTTSTLRAWAAAERMHHRYLIGLILHLVLKRGEATAVEAVFRLFRTQHEEKFLPAIKSLGLEGLPPAVAAARYIYLSNLSGGVKVQYMPESDRKCWVRYPPPRWIWDGAAIGGVPTSVALAMPRGFHAHCGVSLGNLRLGFVCTKITTDGEPGLEGYFYEHDRELAPEERLRRDSSEHAPDFDPGLAPKLPWTTPERIAKAKRNYALQYIRTFLPVLCGLLGDAEAAALARHVGRLIGLQHQEETAAMLGFGGTGAANFAAYLAAMLHGSGDEADWQGDAAEARVTAAGWRLMEGKPAVSPAAFDAWNGLWEGAAAAADRHLALSLEQRRDRGDAAWVWRVRGA
ncbi:MAG TPA: hypothetical protein VMU42_11800 [Candidatus Sulfotelmatobacter sp.]|nr:hypothetical protein [Candidatus Sulfotelmatobacter sp.]